MKELSNYLQNNKKENENNMDKSAFLNLNLTDNIIMKDNKLSSNSEKIEIKNNLAWRLLSDLYMGEIETEGKQLHYYVYVYNVQPGIIIDYTTGKSKLAQ